MLTVGAVARLTRLVTTDAITRGTGQPGDNTDRLGQYVLYDRAQRSALANGETVLPPPTCPTLARVRLAAFRMINCDWCAGMWIAAPVASLAVVADRQQRRGHIHPCWYTVPAAVLTASYAAGWLASHEGT